MKKSILLLITLCVVLDIFAQDVSEQLINTTIEIVGVKDSIVKGKTFTYYSTGTGFYFNFCKNGDTIPVIVTNHHVIKNCHSGYLRFKSYSNGKINYGDLMKIKVEKFESRWIKHPNEDLAIMPLIPLKNEVYNIFKKIPYSISFSETDIPSDSAANELLAIENIFMIGYPKGLSDDINDLPIVRKGITATPVFKDFKGDKRFLLDIAIYPGSSGSPICILNIGGGYADKRGNTIMGNRFYLLGIAVESNNYIAKGATTANDSIPSLEVKTELPYGVAIAIKSNRLFDFKKILFK